MGGTPDRSNSTWATGRLSRQCGTQRSRPIGSKISGRIDDEGPGALQVDSLASMTDQPPHSKPRGWGKEFGSHRRRNCARLAGKQEPRLRLGGSPGLPAAIEVKDPRRQRHRTSIYSRPGILIKHLQPSAVRGRHNWADCVKYFTLLGLSPPYVANVQCWRELWKASYKSPLTPPR